jgi:hypothetical protein
MPANRQDNPSFFGNINLFTNATGTPSYADKVKTIQETQATPSQLSTTWDDASPLPAPTSSGVGAGTSTNALDSINSDNTPTPAATVTQASINTSTANLNQLIPTQANQLDQYASYTYAISWYLLSPQQFNDMTATQRPNVNGWQLLMQSGGAPIKGRSPAFPLDYYMDDLEITTLVPTGGTKMPHSATDIRFKVVEPNGITLIQSIFNAVKLVYSKAQQSQTNTTNNGAPVAASPTTNATPNYLQAQYCLVIEFYGYDSQGKLVAPAKGAFSTNSSTGGLGQNAVIIKYYPFRLVDIKFQIANRAIEYTVTAKPIAQSYGYTTDRGTVPFPITMTGQTVDQLLNGPAAIATPTNTTDQGRTTTTSPPPSPVPQTLSSIATGQDNPLVTSGGMDFSPGNF